MWLVKLPLSDAETYMDADPSSGHCTSIQFPADGLGAAVSDGPHVWSLSTPVGAQRSSWLWPGPVLAIKTIYRVNE